MSRLTCANPYCQKILSRENAYFADKKSTKAYCSRNCFALALSYEIIDAHQRGLKKAERRLKLGALLLKNKLVEPDQLLAALEQQKNSSQKLGEILLESGFITSKDLLRILALQAGVAPVSLDLNCSLKLKDFFPEELFWRLEFVVFLFNEREKELSLAAADAEDLLYLSDLFGRIFPDYAIKYFLEERDKILNILAANFGSNRYLKEKSFGEADNKKIVHMQQDAINFISFLQSIKAEDVRVLTEKNRLQISGRLSDYRFRIFFEP